MPHSPTHKYIHIRIPKTGSVSINAVFGKFHAEHGGQRNLMNGRIGWWFRARHNLWKIGDKHPGRAGHLSAIQMKYILGEKEFNRCFKFSFVRNPWSLIISKYHYTLEGNRPTPEEVRQKIAAGQGRPSRSFHEMSFEDWMTKRYNTVKRKGRDCNQLRKLTDLGGNVIVDFVGRLERMQEDFDTICKSIGIPPLKVPHKNKTNHKHYSMHYDGETREMVADLYRRDIEYFGYTFEEAPEPSFAAETTADTQHQD